MRNKRAKPLSKRQKEALAKMKGQTWKSSYELELSRVTLDALYTRQLVDRFDRFGSGFFPRSLILWRLTATGKEALEKLQRKEAKASHD